MALTRILVVDDNAHFRNAVVDFLKQGEVYEVCGCASSAIEAIKLVDELKPDLVLMDAVLPGTSGLEATHLIKSSPNSPKIIVLTLHDNPAYYSAAMTVGADGFLAKVDLGKALLPAIERLGFPSNSVVPA